MASKQSGALNLPLMILAFLLMGGFLYWLNISSEPSQLAVAEEGSADRLRADSRPVSPAVLGAEAEDYVGELVRVSNIRADALFGPQAFWFLVPTGEEDELASYLVRLNPEFLPDFQVVPGDIMTVTGRVEAMSEEVITQWEGQGFFTEEGQRGLVAELQTYISAVHIEIHSSEAEGIEVDDPDGDDEAETEEG